MPFVTVYIDTETYYLSNANTFNLLGGVGKIVAEELSSKEKVVIPDDVRLTCTKVFRSEGEHLPVPVVIDIKASDYLWRLGSQEKRAKAISKRIKLLFANRCEVGVHLDLRPVTYVTT